MHEPLAAVHSCWHSASVLMSFVGSSWVTAPTIFGTFAKTDRTRAGSRVDKIFLLHQSIDLDVLITVVPVKQIVTRRKHFFHSEVARPGFVHPYAQKGP